MGVGVDFRPCSEVNFLTGRPQSVTGTLAAMTADALSAKLAKWVVFNFAKFYWQSLNPVNWFYIIARTLCVTTETRKESRKVFFTRYNTTIVSTMHYKHRPQSLSCKTLPTTEVGRAPLINFQKLSLNKVFYRLKLFRKFKCYTWMSIPGR